MKINVFSCLNDGRLHQHSLFNHPNIQHIGIRAIHDTPFFNQSIVLLSNHSTNFQVIRYVRRQNVLTPIYIISDFHTRHEEINGVIKWNSLSYDLLFEKLMLFPQKTIWNYVFQLDHQNRQQFMIRSQLLA
jgi:hypothetical protein